MNKNILLGIILYYVLTGMFFYFGAPVLAGYSTTANISAVDTSEQSEGWLSGFSFTRWWLFMSFGIGLGTDTPGWFRWIFMIWETAFSIYVMGFIISSVWNG